MFKLSERSMNRLEGIHEDLVRVVRAAIQISTVDFFVIEGLRTVERQKELFAGGASKTMNSRHITGHAVDLGAIVSGKVTWHPAVYHKIADAMFQAGANENVPLTWGGNWLSFPDLVHFELNRNFYK